MQRGQEERRIERRESRRERLAVMIAGKTAAGGNWVPGQGGGTRDPPRFCWICRWLGRGRRVREAERHHNIHANRHRIRSTVRSTAEHPHKAGTAVGRTQVTVLRTPVTRQESRRHSPVPRSPSSALQSRVFQVTFSGPACLIAVAWRSSQQQIHVVFLFCNKGDSHQRDEVLRIYAFYSQRMHLTISDNL